MVDDSTLVFYAQLLQENDLMIIILVLLIIKSLMEREVTEIHRVIQRQGVHDLLLQLSREDGLRKVHVPNS